MDYSSGILDLLLAFLEGRIDSERYKIGCTAICTGLRSGIFLYTGKEYSSFISDIQEARCIGALQQQYSYLEESCWALSEAFTRAYPPETCSAIKDRYYTLNSKLQDVENKCKDQQSDIDELSAIKEEVRKSMRDFEFTVSKYLKTFGEHLGPKPSPSPWAGQDRPAKRFSFKHPNKKRGPSYRSNNGRSPKNE